MALSNFIIIIFDILDRSKRGWFARFIGVQDDIEEVDDDEAIVEDWFTAVVACSDTMMKDSITENKASVKITERTSVYEQSQGRESLRKWEKVQES